MRLEVQAFVARWALLRERKARFDENGIEMPAAAAVAWSNAETSRATIAGGGL